MLNALRAGMLTTQAVPNTRQGAESPTPQAATADGIMERVRLEARSGEAPWEGMSPRRGGFMLPHAQPGRRLRGRESRVRAAPCSEPLAKLGRGRAAAQSEARQLRSRAPVMGAVD